MKVGLYVGSFNPPHNAHVAIAQHLAEHYLDKVVIMPTGDYWDKKGLLPIEDRISMLKCVSSNKIIIQEEGNNISYTLDILHLLSRQYPDDELYLVLGADNIIKLDKWYKYQEILKYHLAIINRNGIDVRAVLDVLGKPIDECIIIDELKEINISSTEIRQAIAGKNMEAVKDKLPPQVLDYIVQKGLYK